MPSYRHLKDISPSELAPEAAREYSKKEKFSNWFHYSWKWLAAALAGVVLLTFFVTELVTKKNPDITIGIISEQNVPQDIIDKMTEQLQEVIGDYNNDGQVIVSIENFVFAVYTDGSTEPEVNIDPNAQMAGITRFSGALGSAEPMIYIVPQKTAQNLQDSYVLFGTLDGKEPSTTNVNALTQPWNESTFLSSLHLEVEGLDGEKFDGQLYMETFCIGIRAFNGSKLADKKNAEEHWAYIQTIMSILCT